MRTLRRRVLSLDSVDSLKSIKLTTFFQEVSPVPAFRWSSLTDSWSLFTFFLVSIILTRFSSQAES
jgi:hypothetical protein